MNKDSTPANVGSMEGLGGCIDESGNMFDGKEISLFSSTASEHNGEPMKFPLFRLLIVVVSCVFSPSSGQGGPLASRQGGQEFEVCRQMATEVFLQKHLSEVGWNIEGSRVKFDEYVVERSGELCLGLLNKQATSGATGNPAAHPGTANAGRDSANDADTGCEDRVSHVLWAQAGGTLAGLFILAVAGLAAMRRSAA